MTQKLLPLIADDYFPLAPRKAPLALRHTATVLPQIPVVDAKFKEVDAYDARQAAIDAKLSPEMRALRKLYQSMNFYRVDMALSESDPHSAYMHAVALDSQLKVFIARLKRAAR